MKTERVRTTAEANQTRPNGWLSLTAQYLFQFSNKSVVEHNFGTNYVRQHRFHIVQSAGAVEYTDCTSADG